MPLIEKFGSFEEVLSSIAGVSRRDLMFWNSHLSLSAPTSCSVPGRSSLC